MRMRLIYKIMLSFLLIIVLGGAVIAVSVNISTSRAFTAMVRESDIAYARELSIAFSLYYDENGSFKGVRDLLRLPSQMGMQGGIISRGSRSGFESSAKTGSDHMLGRGQFRSLSVILLDADSRVVFSTAESAGVKLPESAGIPVYDSNERQIGTVFAGSMIGSELLPIQKAFLASVRDAILIASVIVLSAALLLSFFLVKHITAPLGILQNASNRIAMGDLGVSISINRKDELGDLGLGFNTMTESLRAAENWKKQIIADSAHELRTPVALIQGHLEMMLEGVYEINRDGIQTLYDETLLLSSLISELQKLSSEEASRSALSKEPFQVEDFFESVKSAFKAKFEEAGISFKTSIDPDISLLNADWQKLYQVFLNLIANSLRYTPSGGSIHISAADDVSSGSIVLAVEDSGCGIPLEERSKIFDRFYRVDKHRNRESGGSGLGLAISREIIKNHGGTIEVVDPLSGRGTRIQISLPL